MEFVPSICLSSLAGAVLFFTGGRLSSRGPSADGRAALEAVERERARLAEELAGARAAHDDAVRAVAEQRARAAALREQLDAERAARLDAERRAAAEVARLGEEGTRLRAQGLELGEQLAALRARAAHDVGELARLKGLGSAAEARAAAAEKRVAVFATDLDKARRALQDAVAAGARDAQELAAARAGTAHLREENAELTRARDALQAERAHRAAGAADLAELQRRNVELAMRTRVLDQRAGEMERKDAENAELRTRIEALAHVSAESAELRRRVLDLEARGFAQQLQEAPAPIRPTRPAGEPPRLETSLEQGLAEVVARDPGCRTAVLSDLRGLLIACAGAEDHQHELAAATSLTTYATERLRELVPLGEPASLELRDENGLVVRTRWLRWEHERFLLSTLGAAPGREASEIAIQELTARLSALIGGA
jgi:chromosome segregation ATPase